MKIKYILFLIIFLSFFFLFPKNVHADQVTYTISFATDYEGFSWVSTKCTGTCTQGWYDGDGNPADSVYAKVTERNKVNEGYHKKNTLTWENMGVPAGATVTSIDGKFDVKNAQETHAATHAIGTYLYDSADTTNILTGGVTLESDFDPTSTSWVTINADTAKNVDSAYQASNTTVSIRIKENVASGNNASAASDIRVDNVVLVINYTPAASGPTKVVFTNAQRTLTAGACNGDADVLTIQLQDAASTPTNPTGSTVIRVSSGSPDYTIYSDNTCVTTVTNGDFTFTTAQNTKSVYIKDFRKSGTTWTLTAAKQSGPDTIANGTQSITINAGAVTRLVVTLPSQTFTDGVGNSGTVINQTAGSAFNLTKISATDSYFNVNTSYTGAKTLAYAGPANAPDSTPPSYTTSVSFTSGQSTTTLATTLYKAETPTITATDAGSYGYASSSLTVDAGAINNYLVTASTPQTTAVCFTGTNTITARDQWLNTRTLDASVANMTTSGTSITFYTTAGCTGVTTQYTMSSGQVTMYIKTPKKQSGITVTATRNGFTETGTSGVITVDPAAANALLVRLPGQTFTDGTGISGTPNFTGLRTPNATAGTSYTVDFKAVDANNNLVNSGSNNYNGNKTISFADSVAGNAPNSQAPSFPGSPVTFTNGEANALSVTYYNAATGRTVEADDTATPVSGTTSTTFTVQAEAVNNYGVSASTPQTAGVAFNVTVTARDSWNNSLGSLYSAPAGTYIWTTTAANAPDTTAPTIGTLIQGNFVSGVATKSVTLYKAESGVTFTASEPSPSTVTGISSGVTVNPGSISADVNDSTVTGDASVNTNTNTTITITLKDTWRNPKSSVPAADVVLSATPTETITQPSSPTDASGVTTGQIKWSNIGDKTVTVTIQTSTLVQNDGSTPDADGKLDDTHTITVVFSAKVEIKGGTELRGGSLLGQ